MDRLFVDHEEVRVVADGLHEMSDELRPGGPDQPSADWEAACGADLLPDVQDMQAAWRSEVVATANALGEFAARLDVILASTDAADASLARAAR
ncbi:hypothetical protein CLV28_1140 [Sediminihabitans luteus]|uniref:Uncharacterized protein n=1 Tax=Sediminihabitans luteus TaxID=1138585 RepID=A0A2M9D132_9CELL|nr:hypothetical protein [Sediminihabitans luteus]PJJ77914.1 hypothetical protein CLV28_1140 [Sediminihabitans luteus]GII99729.1 hypothetical protein Slu03_21070 [Sediminihabitans luteus]